MAQTGYTPISIYYSSTAAATPTAGNLVAGELAINTADGKLFYKDSSGVVQTIASKAGALGDVVGPSSATDNAVARFDTTTGKLIQNSLVTISDTGAISAPVDASISGLNVGKGGGAISTNTSVGLLALVNNTSGTQTTAIGTTCLANNTTASNNTAVGFYAAVSTTTGNNNNAFGVNTLQANTTGSNNTAYGHNSLYSNTTANSNTAVGYQAGYSNTTGTELVAFGYQAAYSNTTANSNNAFGLAALYATTTGAQNTAIGHRSLTANVTGTANTGVGFGTLITNTASNNTAVGNSTLYNNTSGAFNSGFGVNAGYFNTTGSYNAFFGHDSANRNTTGSYNTFLGDGAGFYNTTASDNTAVGYQAGYAVTGASNTLIGRSSGSGITSGTSNVCVGLLAGAQTTPLTTGLNNTFIGNYTIPSSASTSNEIVIGYNATGKGANTGFIFPNGGGVYQGNNSSTWSTTSDQRLKKSIVDNNTGLDKLLSIQVRNFEYRLPNEVTELPQNQAILKEGVQLGVIAQELQKVLPECVNEESTGVLRVDTDNLTWYLINAVKELKAEIDQLKGK
jgi:hypothetical protein